MLQHSVSPFQLVLSGRVVTTGNFLATLILVMLVRRAEQLVPLNTLLLLPLLPRELSLLLLLPMQLETSTQATCVVNLVRYYC